MTIIHNQAAIQILTIAVQQLQAIGIDCMLSSLSLPQGTSLNLHAGESVTAVLAANVATTRGGQQAHTAAEADSFAEEVAESLAEATILKAAHIPPK